MLDILIFIFATFILLTLFGNWVVRKYPNSWLGIIWDDLTDITPHIKKMMKIYLVGYLVKK